MLSKVLRLVPYTGAASSAGRGPTITGAESLPDSRRRNRMALLKRGAHQNHLEGLSERRPLGHPETYRYGAHAEAEDSTGWSHTY